MSDKEPALAPGPAAPAARTGRDIIPIWLLVTIFGLVIWLVIYLMRETWTLEWNRYRSLQAQATRNHKAAIEPLLWLVARGENSPSYLSELGHCYLTQADHDNALKYLELAQKHRANIPVDDQGNAREPVDFSTYLGRAWYGKGDLVQAEKHLMAGLKFNKLDPYANYYLGEIEMKRNNYVKAADYFKVVARDPAFEKDVKKHYAEIEQKLFAAVDRAESTGPQVTTATLSK